MRLNSELIILRFSTSDTTSASRMKTMPRARRIAFVRRIRPMRKYISPATSRMSTMSDRLIVSI